ncbi:putative at hook domain-containing protein [Golovinomyces cichoracearum]|uniref:Putative at hook domain-containing protein n=1 Tax=Golovinomyces cichoracearum TaxID=62708 RepID=A0A420IYC5_9PEZI|nr:putative at hook domain-containing protein [Golovinomyces cichoracearum]
MNFSLLSQPDQLTRSGSSFLLDCITSTDIYHGQFIINTLIYTYQSNDYRNKDTVPSTTSDVVQLLSDKSDLSASKNVIFQWYFKLIFNNNRIMGSRVERMQQRLRGVLRREVKDVDFGLVLPSISNPRSPTPTSEPQTFLNQQQTTPEPEKSGQSTSLTSSQLPPTAVISKNTEERFSKSTRSANANTSKKRRKLDDNQTPSTPSRVVRLSPKENISQNFQSAEDDARKNGALAKDSKNFIDATSPEKGSSIISSYTESLTPRTTPTKSRRLFEVTESPINAPGSGKLVQTEELILSNSQKNTLPSSSLKRTFDKTLSSSQQRRKKMSGVKSGGLDLSKATSSVNASAQANDDDDIDELSPERTPLSGYHAGSRVRVRMSSTNDEREQKSFEHVQDEYETVTLQENLNQNNNTARIGSPDLDLPIIKLASEKQHRKKFITKPQISDIQENINPRSKIPKGESKAQSSGKSTTKDKLQKLNTQIAAASDTVDDDDDECDEFETLRIEKTHSKPRDFNYIDLLSQALRKIIGSRISALQERADACENEDIRRDLKTKNGALEAFGKEIKSRLLDHAVDLDYAQSLETRLRNEQKKKIRLRSEILRIRAERETIALRMDDIRKRHNTAQKENMNRLSLNNAIHNLEIAIETVRDSTYHPNYDSISDIDSTQARLKKVAQLISHRSDTGGLLRQVKDFNSLLERSAIALEKK